MLTLFYGTDVTRVRTEALKKAHTCVPEGGHVQVITGESGGEALIKDAIGATSLFTPYEVFVLDTLSDDTDLFTVLKRLIPDIVESKNEFVCIEHTLGVRDLKAFSDFTKSIHEYKEKEKSEFNVFRLGDALCARDKKTLWILLQEAWREGKTAEELIGTLLWQLKMLRLAEVTGSALESGQKPFVYTKARNALHNFADGELSALSLKLTVLYHEGHTGKRNINDALEQWVLSL